MHRGAIFDLDGTLLDSMNVWSDIDTEFFRRHDRICPPDYLQAIAPMGFARAAEYTITRFCLPLTVEEVVREWQEMAVEAYREGVLLKPHAAQYLRQLKAQGVKLAIATASQEAQFIPALQHGGVWELFDAVTLVSEVEHGKGFPDIYQKAAEKLGVSVEECAVFEDLLECVRGAKAGGFYTIAVADDHSAEFRSEIIASADRFIEDFGELLGETL